MLSMWTILIVDGDPTIRETLREQLIRDNDFAVVEATSAREAELRMSATARFAAVIMAAELPDDDGHAVCVRLRAGGFAMPLILLDGSDRYCAADDLITIAKPFRLSELMAHLRNLLNAPTTMMVTRNPPSSVRIGPYEFSLEEKVLRHDATNCRIRLTEKEAAILAFLHSVRGRSVPRWELLREVWGYHPSVTTHTLETHIYRLRRKLEANPMKARLLNTEAGGYRLVWGPL